MDTNQIQRAAESLHSGRLVAYPTEAVYGIGCDPCNIPAIERLLALKQRSWTKGLILIAANFKQLQPYLSIADSALPQAVQDSWPGPNTWLLPAHPKVTTLLRGEHNTLAVRITAHPEAAALCDSFGGAIVSTSANLTGQPAARSLNDLDQALITSVDVIVSGETNPLLQPSQIKDAFTGKTIR
jgi:L-threonylcarbamoyladenylate synthase